MAAPSLIELKNAHLGYGRKAVLRDVELAIPKGSLVGILGPNGAGKTTLLRTVLGRLRPLRGTRVLAPGVRVGYVPQHKALDPIFPFTVWDVVLMGRYATLGAMGRVGATDRRLALAALSRVGISDLSERPYRELSGGQQQRAIVARALAVDPDVLVLDEPTASLDVHAEAEVFGLVRDLHREGKAIVMVSHDLAAVAELATDVAIVEAGRVAMGTAEALLTDSTLSQLYGRPIHVEVRSGHRHITACLPVARADAPHATDAPDANRGGAT
ncbi:MAG: metal ABC transporter ATP-binding protein [Planctomycetota bacterium]|jgi:ABC-type Mn2+/Zn2+ transport system ATPase subunit